MQKGEKYYLHNHVRPEDAKVLLATVMFGGFRVGWPGGCGVFYIGQSR